MITTSSVAEFLAGQRIAVIGASDDKANFGATIYRALREYGYDVVAVNPNAEAVAGDRCYADLGSVPAPIDGAIVMVNQALAVDVVRACAEHHVHRVWLFKGLGGPGALSDEAVQLCRDNSIDVVAGACPLMFLEPVGWFHKVHRSVRHLNGSLSKAS
jgi:predicted CoA-binding protein